MTKILKRPLSVLLAVLMIAGIFAAVPMTAYAATAVDYQTFFVSGINGGQNIDVVSGTGAVDVTNDTTNTRGVTWDAQEKCAVFDGAAYLVIPNPLRNANASTGFTITMEAYISSANNSSGYYINNRGQNVRKSGWQRLFDLSDGTIKKYLYINGGSAKEYPSGSIAHLRFAVATTGDPGRGGDEQGFSPSGVNYYDAWHTYSLVVKPGGNMYLYVDGTQLSSLTANATVISALNNINNISSFNTCYIGTSVFETTNAGSDGFFIGKIRGFSTVSASDVFTLSYNTNGGAESYTSVATPIIPANLPTPTKANNVFGGWYTDSALTKPAISGTKLTANTTLYAKWLPLYTVTWKMDNGTTIDTTSVAQGTAPTHADPTKPDDAQYTYTFAGWQNGTTTYAPDTALPPVTGDTTYTATFTQTKKKLFAKHSIALNGNIGMNFFLDLSAINVDLSNVDSARVQFTWDDGHYTAEVDLKSVRPDSDGLYKATCDVVAAHMAHKIHAEVYIDGVKQDETDDFSVQDRAEAILADPAKYDMRNNPEALVTLVKELLNYGAMAQIAFDSNLYEKPALANTKAISDYDYVMADVTADDVLNAIKASNNGKSGADMTAVAASLGANWYTTSMIYMSENTIKHYFTKATDDFVPTDYQGSQKDYYYYVQKVDIAAAELDELQSFTVGDVTFQYSALDYVKTVIESNKMEDAAKNIAKALFLYNQAANAYFDTPVIITT